MAMIQVYDINKKEVDKIKIDSKILDKKVNEAVIQQAVRMYLANRRNGSANTKTRAEVRGGGAKPWKQKGTGRARAGSNSSPLWRKGGVTFGPKPRDFHYSIPKKVKDLALRSAVNIKYKDNQIMLIDSLVIKSGKTKDAASIFSKFCPGKKVLVIKDKIDESTAGSIRNLPDIKVMSSANVSTYDILAHDILFCDRDSFANFSNRMMHKE
ncbi:MAG: 50S ribosomal protein L4 [bacterium]|nr:50S ribosomal protein L4 [bacterium]